MDAPPSASASAIARPMLRPAPVTMATLPLSSLLVMYALSRSLPDCQPHGFRFRYSFIGTTSEHGHDRTSWKFRKTIEGRDAVRAAARMAKNSSGVSHFADPET